MDSNVGIDEESAIMTAAEVSEKGSLPSQVRLSSQDVHRQVEEKFKYLEDDRDRKDREKDQFYRSRAEKLREIAHKEGRRYIPPLYTFDQVPSFLQDNDGVRGSYRAYCSFGDTWASIFRIHNDTGNIWSHLFGFGLALWLMISSILDLPSSSSVLDSFALSFFFVSAMGCFIASCLFHTHYCQSSSAFRSFICIDFGGISMMIAGSCVVVTYFTFYCKPIERNFWILLTVITSSVGIVGPFFKVWHKNSFRSIRALIYTLSGIISGVPVLQYLFIVGLPPDVGASVYTGIALMGSFYIGGVLIYTYRIPERLFPGKFDILFHSHQLWHICVVAAFYSHYHSAKALLEWRLQDKCVA